VHLEAIDDTLIDERTKGIPGGTRPFRLGDIGAKGWNVLRQDMPLPLAVLKAPALLANSRWMQRFLAVTGARICPHGKTTMSPPLFARQLADGAWGLTAATVGHVQVYRRYGVARILLANQLIGRPEIRYVLDALARDPDFDFYCLVDSVAGVRLLAEAARARTVGRPLQVLLEGGVAGGRTGCRDLDSALAVARAVAEAGPMLALRGVEGFEGVLQGADPAISEARVAAFLSFLVEIAATCAEENLFAPGPVILSAGGSTYYDMVVKRFRDAPLPREVMVVTRSGCYLTHDSLRYAEDFRRIAERTPEAAEIGPPPAPALELWAHVQSRPEPTRVICTVGRRDVSFDAGLPVPEHWSPAGTEAPPQALGAGHATVALNDQHAFLDVPAGSPLAVGDMVAFGISHPCTTFDKWRVLYVVDDAYDVVGSVPTFF